MKIILLSLMAMCVNVVYGIDIMMLGIEMSPITLKESIKNRITPNEGIGVRDVFQYSTADECGVQIGDVIVKINESPINRMMDLRYFMSEMKDGEIMLISLLRDGKEVVVTGFSKTLDFEGEWNAIDSKEEERFRVWNTKRYNEWLKRNENK